MIFPGVPSDPTSNPTSDPRPDPTSDPTSDMTSDLRSKSLLVDFRLLYFSPRVIKSSFDQLCRWRSVNFMPKKQWNLDETESVTTLSAA